MIVIGWNPTPVLHRMEPSVRVVLERVESAREAAALPESDVDVASLPDAVEAPDSPSGPPAGASAAGGDE
jgi:hypothetical protein